MYQASTTRVRDGESPQGGLRPWQVYLLFFAWTLFAVFLYSRFSGLGDSQAYLTGAYDDDEHQLRTIIIQGLAEAVFAAVHNDLLSHLVFSGWAATGVVYMVKNAQLHDNYRWPLLMILLMPNFGVWASVIGRESVFVGFLGFFMGAVLGYWRKPTFHRAALAILCIGAMTFIRSPYGAGMAIFFLMFLMYRSGPRMHLSTGVQALLLLGIAGLVLVVIWPYLDSYITDDVLPRAKRYFSLSSDNTRTWIEVDTTRQYLISLWWSLPLALVGPTPAEVMARPVTVPFFLSGLVIFFSVLNSIRVAFGAPAGRVRKVLVLGWFPAIMLILIAYVPFGIYNSGSAIRYASCFLPFIVFPSLLLSVVSAQEAELAEALGDEVEMMFTDVGPSLLGERSVRLLPGIELK